MLLAAIAFGTLAMWAVGRIATDRLLVTQFLFWAPAWLYFGAATIVGALALPLRGAGRSRAAAIAAGAFGVAGLLAPLARRGDAPAPDPSPQALRFVHWNLSSPDTHTWSGDLAAGMGLDQPADVYFLGVTAESSRLEAWAAPLGEDYIVRRMGVFALVSRIPFEVRQFTLSLGGVAGASRVSGNAAESRFQRTYNRLADWLGFSRREFGLPDEGWLIAATFDAAPEQGGPITVYCIDLPSNPFISRWKLAKAAAERITTLEREQSLPPPRIILGDFNIPAGSASLGLLRRGFEHAARTAAVRRGSHATWPRARPLLAIDHAFIAPELTTRLYESIDPRISDHMAILVEVVREAP